MMNDMAPVNSTIDKFGRKYRDNDTILRRGPPGIGFKVTKDKHYDIQGKRLKNVGDPVDPQDAATRNYVDHCIIESTTRCTAKESELLKQMVSYIDNALVQYKADNATQYTDLTKRIAQLEEKIARKKDADTQLGLTTPTEYFGTLVTE